MKKTNFYFDNVFWYWQKLQSVTAAASASRTRFPCLFPLCFIRYDNGCDKINQNCQPDTEKGKQYPYDSDNCWVQVQILPQPSTDTT